jgi:hypothetical protein
VQSGPIRVFEALREELRRRAAGGDAASSARAGSVGEAQRCARGWLLRPAPASPEPMDVPALFCWMPQLESEMSVTPKQK